MSAVTIGAACSEPASVATEAPLDGGARFEVVPETWTFSDLGNIGGSDMLFETTAINDSGHIAGYGLSQQGPRVAWRWRNGAFQWTLPAAWSSASAYGMNNRGDIFGSITPDTENEPSTDLIWHFEPNYHIQNSFADHTKEVAEFGQDINYFGYAVGWQRVYKEGIDTANEEVLLWVPTKPTFPWTSKPVVLGPLSNNDKGYAINDLGTTIGSTKAGAPKSRAWFKGLNGPMAMLPISPFFEESWAGNINDADVTVGVARSKASGKNRFVIWRGTSGPYDLAVPLTASFNMGTDTRAPVRISDKGRIAGTAEDLVNQVDQPFTFKNGVLTILPLPNNSRALVSGINTCGEIVGTIIYHTGMRKLIRWRRMHLSFHVCDY